MTATAATGFARGLAEQLAYPAGWAGRLLGAAMDVVNRRPTRLAVDLLDPRPGESVLDAGCGTGAAMAAVLRRADCRVTGIDPSPVMLGAAGRRLAGSGAELRQAGLGDLPFPDACFDAALLLNVLYFADREGRMLTDLRRVLKPGGRAVAYVTHRETMRNWSFTRAGLHRLFDEDELTEAFVTAGFARERVSVHAVPVARSITGLLVEARR